MEKFKKLKLVLISLLMALIVALTAAVFAANRRGTAAFADDRYVQLDGNSVFYTAIKGAKIEAGEPLGDGEDAHRYTLFKIGNGQTVSYRQNLAYKWISASGTEDGKPTTRTMSMELYFPEINFKRFYIKFESQQYTLTKDGKSANYLVFTSVENGEKVQVSVSQSKAVEEKDGEIAAEDIVDIVKVAANENINFELGAAAGEYSEGNYVVKINGETADGALFKNVYEKYASYVASGDNAVTPLTFGAVFDDESKLDNEAQMALVDISGQSFEMFDKDGTFKIKDTAAPVLCFSQTPSYLEYGKSIGFQYSVIDVIASSPRATAYYYVLTGEQFASDTFDYDRTDYDAKTTDNEGEGEDDTEKEESPFIKVASSSSERIYTDAETFIPKKYLSSDSDVMGLVKIYYELSDVSSTSTAQTDKVFVDWYVEGELGEDNDALENVYKYKNMSGTSNFLRLIKGKEGATYASAGDAAAEDPLVAYKKSVADFQRDYQSAIDAAIYGMEDHKLYAGGNKFYLPAIEFDFMDDYLAGTDYKYSIYYRGSTSGSHTSLASNKLAIDLNDADVTYRFTIYITDTFGNPMRYPTLNDENEVVWEEIKTSDVWEEDFAELLPFFEFDVSYKQATAEEPENLSISYVGNNYSGVSFKITGVSGTYTSTYNLYVFDRNAFYSDTHEVLDYDTFTSENNTEKLFNNTYKEGVNTRKYFTTVKPLSELLESDEKYEDFKALNWNATSISFTPQSVEDFYVVELQLTDKRSQDSKPYFATVASSVQTTALKGEEESWIENNKTSVILFVVAGVCLVALVVLLVVKPKDKGDIDAVYTEIESKDKKQPKKNKK